MLKVIILSVVLSLSLLSCSKGDFDPTITIIKEVIKSTKSTTYEDNK